MSQGAGAAVIAILRYGNTFDGPWAQDAIPLAAAGHRIGMSPGFAGEALCGSARLVEDKVKRIVWEAGSRQRRSLPLASVPREKPEWMDG